MSQPTVALPVPQPEKPATQPTAPAPNQQPALGVFRIVCAALAVMAVVFLTPVLLGLYEEEYTAMPAFVFTTKYVWVAVALSLAASMAAVQFPADKNSTLLLVVACGIPFVYACFFTMLIIKPFMLGDGAFFFVIAFFLNLITAIFLIVKAKRWPVISVVGLYAIPYVSAYAALAVFFLAFAVVGLWFLDHALYPRIYIRNGK